MIDHFVIGGRASKASIRATRFTTAVVRSPAHAIRAVGGQRITWISIDRVAATCKSPRVKVGVVPCNTIGNASARRLSAAVVEHVVSIAHGTDDQIRAGYRTTTDQ